MPKSSLADVTVLLVESDAAESYRLSCEMVARGYSNVTRVGSLRDAYTTCNNRMFDVVVYEGGKQAEALPRAMRFGQVGDNPYLVMFCTLKQAERSVVMQTINGGVDNLLVKPFPASILIDRLNAMVHVRKPFVVAIDFIGPERPADRQNDPDLPLLAVPNTLRDKAIDAYDLETTLQAIRRANTQVNSQMIIQCMRRVTPTVQNITAIWEGGMKVDTRPHLDQLKRLVSTIERRLKGTPDEHVAELCTGTLSVIDNLMRDYLSPAIKDIRLLQNLAQSLHMSLNPDERIAELSREIAGSVLDAARGTGGD